MLQHYSVPPPLWFCTDFFYLNAQGKCHISLTIFGFLPVRRQPFMKMIMRYFVRTILGV